MRCNGDGTAEIIESCSLGCSTSALRCNDVDPSNGLAPYLDVATSEPDIDLGMAALINTSNGTVVADGKSMEVRSALVAQANAPTILVFVVHSLRANDVMITGSNAFAVVGAGDLQIGGVLTASGSEAVPGAGGFNDSACKGAGGTSSSPAFAGSGGGGFGGAGGKGGSTVTDSSSQTGGLGGTVTGNPTLTPLRGGCDGAHSPVSTASFGAGGGAIQLVSRTRISVNGVIAANGSSGFGGGGSGGGILIEAPVVEVSGSIVANGGAGAAGCISHGEDGRLDATPAAGGSGCTSAAAASGGDGGAGSIPARDGMSLNFAGTGAATAIAGHGGGGVGRIRINAAPGGFHRAGLFSPDPSTGTIATR